MVKKTKKVKSDIISDTNEDTDTIRKFIIILVGVALVTLGLYFLSSKYLIKDGVIKEKEPVEEQISYDTILGGNIFNRSEGDYYVLAYDPDSLKASYYAAILNKFDKKDSKIYYMNLSLEANKQYVKEEGNKSATKPSELAIKEPTLIKIKDGKIEKYLENVEDIEKELK